MKWRDAVLSAIRRYCGRHFSRENRRSRILDKELVQLVHDTGSKGKTPDLTFNRVLHELRDEGLVEFVDVGSPGTELEFAL